ncbi:MAG: type II secretion system protein [Lachnospiraceae bacterium]|nr:type II secretion system protein [Lachnospiraceae bacterium]
MRKNQKGFTLVELIVVLVILAILAAMLVPALLGYIDKARDGKYVEEVHSIYTAAQVIGDERYAKNSDDSNGFDSKPIDPDKELGEINKMVAPAVVTSISIKAKGTASHDAFTISNLVVKYSSQDGTEMNGKLEDGAVTTWK